MAVQPLLLFTPSLMLKNSCTAIHSVTRCITSQMDKMCFETFVNMYWDDQERAKEDYFVACIRSTFYLIPQGLALVKANKCPGDGM